MMWMMLICCAAPLLLIAFLGLGGKALGASNWLVIGGVALMGGAHLFMMRGHRSHGDEERSHKHPDEDDASAGTEDKSDAASAQAPKTKDEGKKDKHSCCH